jgi:hypothetical protein
MGDPHMWLWQKPHDRACRQGFTRAAFPNKAEDFARTDGQRQILQCEGTIRALRQSDLQVLNF